MAHVAQWKKDEVKNLQNLIDNHPVVGIANLADIPAPQMQKMRETLRGNAQLKMSRINLMNLALDQTNAIRASGAMEKKFDDLLGKNLNLNVDSIFDEVSAQLGMEVRDVLGDELLEHIHQNLPEAMNAGTLDSFKVQTRQMVNDHIEDLFNKQLENVVEHVKSQAVAGGPNVWAKKLGEAQDIFWGVHIEHSIRMPEATRLAREASAAGE